MFSNYVMSDEQMAEWKEICRAFAKKFGMTLLFVNNTSCGLEKDGVFHHLYVDEMVDALKNVR